MVYGKQLFTSLLSLLLLAFLAGCKDELIIDNTDQNFPLTLQTTAANDKVILHWDAVNVSNFEKYVVVRSRNPIPIGLRPVFSTGDVEIIFQSDISDTTSFVDAALPIVQKLYYKLYVGFGERFVESAATEISFDNLLVEGNGGVIKFVADSNWVILGDEFTGILRVVDYSTKQIKSQRSVQFTNGDNMCLDVAVENGKSVLYWWAGYNNLFKYSLPDLTQLNYWSVPFSGFSLIAGEGDRIYTTQYDFNESFAARRKTDMSVVKAHYRTDYYTHRTLLMLDKTTNRMVEASPYRIMVYNVDAATGNVTNLVEKTTNTFSVFYRDIPVSKNGQYFVPQFDGSVYDQNLNLVLQVPLLNNGYADLDFSPDGLYLYVAYLDFTFGGTLIQKMKFPSLEVIGTRRFTSASPRVIEAVPGGVVFVGSGVNGLNQVLVKKIDL
ncbi:MAG: hypothetical protein IT262_10515 [Saprospiraceae bacterium]|nr:hypothetical protein [Saprospiraceae bacterium]